MAGVAIDTVEDMKVRRGNIIVLNNFFNLHWSLPYLFQF